MSDSFLGFPDTDFDVFRDGKQLGTLPYKDLRHAITRAREDGAVDG